MSKIAAGNHTFFDECIEIFRPKDPSTNGQRDVRSYSYLLTNFEILFPWDLPNCTVHPTTKINLPGRYSAYVSTIENPLISAFENPQNFGTALSAIISFVTGCPCKSTRDNPAARDGSLTNEEKITISMYHPIRTCGANTSSRGFSSKKLEIYAKETSQLIEILLALPYKTYVVAMQAIRLVQLSHINLREDFGLAYLLIVSAIEAISQQAYKKSKSQLDEKEAEWKRLTKISGADPEFINLFNAYKNIRDRTPKSKTYLEFINRYAPATCWEDITPRPFDESRDYHNEIFTSMGCEPSPEWKYYETPPHMQPSNLSSEEINKIISNSYNHRSRYVHEGAQPPHRASESREVYFESENSSGFFMEEKQNLLPTYTLLSSIATHSITSWLKTLTQKP